MKSLNPADSMHASMERVLRKQAVLYCAHSSQSFLSAYSSTVGYDIQDENNVMIIMMLVKISILVRQSIYRDQETNVGAPLIICIFLFRSTFRD